MFWGFCIFSVTVLSLINTVRRRLQINYYKEMSLVSQLWEVVSAVIEFVLCEFVKRKSMKKLGFLVL